MNSLTIVIPTYNRAKRALAQAEKLAAQIKQGHLGESVSLVVSDNASTDETRGLLEPFLLRVEGRYCRNDSNIGLAGNYCRCIELAKTDFVWVVGDDDEIDGHCVETIVKELKDRPDLNLLMLNFRQRDGETGKLLKERYYCSDDCGAFAGLDDVVRLLQNVHHSAMMWITGSVLSVRAAAEALRAVRSRESLATPLFVALHAACGGPWMIMNEPQATMVLGQGSWEAYYRRIYGIEVPAILRRLREVGWDLSCVPQFQAVMATRFKTLLGDIRRRGFASLADLWRL